jgi:hypothetical protein
MQKIENKTYPYEFKRTTSLTCQKYYEEQSLAANKGTSLGTAGMTADVPSTWTSQT